MNKNKKTITTKVEFNDFLKKQEKFSGDTEQLYNLIQGVEHWNNWINAEKEKNHDLQINLSNVDLSKEKIKNTKLWNPDIWNKGANLQNIDFTNCILLNGNIPFANLSCSKLQNSMMEHTNLKNSNFSESFLDNSNFNNCNLQSSNFYYAQMGNMKLENANMKNCNLVDANLTYAYLDSSNLEYSDLQNAKMQNCYLGNANLEHTNLAYADLKNAYLWKANLKKSNLSDTNMQKADLLDAHLENADLRETNLENANLRSAYFNNAELIKVIINKETDCTNTIFNSCIFNTNPNCNENEVIEALSKGLVNNIQFIDSVFGRKVRDEAWLYDWRRGIEKLKNTSYELSNFKIINYFKWIKYNSKEYIWKSILKWLWENTSDYGRNIWKWIKWSFGIVLMFSLIFWIFFPNQFIVAEQIKIYEKDNFNYFISFFKFFYHSVVTFTTLGFGDITPKTPLAMFFVVIEVILGYIMLGGLISIFANKIARRND